MKEYKTIDYPADEESIDITFTKESENGWDVVSILLLEHSVLVIYAKEKTEC